LSGFHGVVSLNFFTESAITASQSMTNDSSAITERLNIDELIRELQN